LKTAAGSRDPIKTFEDASKTFLLNFQGVALFADVETFRRAELIGQPRRFVNVAAEKVERLFAFDPGAEGGAAGVLAGSVFV
jgi:hypothetical protein